MVGPGAKTKFSLSATGYESRFVISSPVRKKVVLISVHAEKNIHSISQRTQFRLSCLSLRSVGLSVSGAEETATLLSQIIVGRCALALPLIVCALRLFSSSLRHCRVSLDSSHAMGQHLIMTRLKTLKLWGVKQENIKTESESSKMFFFHLLETSEKNKNEPVDRMILWVLTDMMTSAWIIKQGGRNINTFSVCTLVFFNLFETTFSKRAHL